MKKVISVLLSILIVMSVVTVPVSAESITATKEDNASFVEMANDAVDFFMHLINSIHDLVGGILSIFNKKCPFCGDIHKKDIDNVDENVTIDDSVFLFNEETSKYYIFEKVEKVSGTVADAENVECITFTVSDINGNLIDSGNISVAEIWSTSDIGFFIGENILVVSAEYKSGSVVVDTINIDCYIDSYMNDLVIDTVTDTDGDMVVDYLEINYTNTDINNADTDSDGLTDYQEIVILRYDPLNKDTDKDGIEDAYEDCDNDGLTNIFEIENNLDPKFDDTDLDELSDGVEINVYNTDALNKDTDCDTVSDGDEIAIGSDPLISENSFTAHTSFGTLSEESPVAVEVDTNLSASQVGTLKIAPVTVADNGHFSPSIPGYLGNGFEITVDGNVTNATLTFNYDPSFGEPDENFQPRIYYFNEEDKTFEELPNQTVGNGKVSADIPHFSQYILLNKIEFDKVWNEEIKKPITDSEGYATNIDVSFVIDVSGSMSGSRLTTAKTALNSFIDALGEKDRAALIKFSEYSSVLSELTTDKTSLKNKVSSLSATGLTSMYRGFQSALDLLSDVNNTYGYKMIVLLSDGKDEPSTSYNSKYAPLVETAIANDIVVYTIGVGSGIDVSVLTKIANNTGGSYYHASSSSEIINVFDDLQSSTVDITTDTNNDGISDYYTQLLYEGKIALSNGSLEFRGIDLNYDNNGNLCDDFDGDGLKNGQELIVKETSNGVCIVMNSDPITEYSDSDIWPDNYEYTSGSDPMVPSYPAPQINYVLDDSNFTYIQVLNNEDSTIDSIARNMWSTITFNWSHEDEALRLIAGFAKEYADVSNIKDLAESVKKDLATQVCSQAIAFLNSLNDDVASPSIQIADTIIGIKQAASAARRTNVNANWFGTLKAWLGQFNYLGKTKFYTKVGDAGKYATAGFTIVSEALDLYDICNTYSILAATSDAFMKMEEMLTYVKNNDAQKERYVGKAAATALATISDEYNKFLSSEAWEITVATSENLASMAVSLLSAANPFVAAVNLLVFVIDIALPITEIGEGVYSLYVVDEISNACIALFDYESASSAYYDIDNTEIKYIDWLIFARMHGGKFAKLITSKQHYWGMFNDKEIRQQYADAINRENSTLEQCFTTIQKCN